MSAVDIFLIGLLIFAFSSSTTGEIIGGALMFLGAIK